MLRDEAIRYQAWVSHKLKFNRLLAGAGFTPQQMDVMKQISLMILELVRVVWKEEGELMKPADPHG
jgi:hypothetical protein